MIAQLAGISEQLDALFNAHPPTAGVLSVYLDTSAASDSDRAFFVRFRDGCRALRQQLGDGDGEPFDGAAARAEAYLATQFVPGQPGLALFASADSGYLFAIRLPIAPDEEVSWESRPQLAQLQILLQQYGRVGVVLINKERARLFAVTLGAVEAQRTVRDYVPGKQATGDWFALSQTRIARHHEEHVYRHVTHTLHALRELQAAYPFDRLVIGGPDEALASLLHHLPDEFRRRLAGTFTAGMYAGDDEVVAAALEAAERSEREGELQAVDDLLDAATARIALGTAAVFEALQAGRVRSLLIADTFTRGGLECGGCHRLDARPGACSACGGEMVPADVRERAIEQALDQGATVAVLGAEASTKLQAAGGIGAWTRY